MIWWHRVNWLVAFQVMGIGDKLPQWFELITLEKLTLNTDNTIISFEKFADSLIEETGLTWTSQDTTYHQKLLRGAIEKIVIRIHSQFGIIETEYEDDFIGTYNTTKLKSFCFTKVGKILIESTRMSFS